MSSDVESQGHVLGDRGLLAIATGWATVTPDTRYQLLEKLGSGSFAVVYRAKDLELGREVAIKQLHSEYLADPNRLSRYWQEAQLLASLQHPNIVTIFDIVRERGWLVMELMQSNLQERLQGRQIDLRALRATLAHSLRALKYLHSRGIIHGDIKPGNLMIDSRRRVKLGDFGLARRASDDSGSLLKGTTKYMAPECVSEDFGEVGPASDLYSLGFSAYELMCGAHFEDLFPGLNAGGRNKPVAWMMWHAAPDRRLPEISRVLDGVPPDLATVIQRLTEKDPALRYKSADEALSDLKVDLKVIGGGPEPIDEPAAEDGSKRRTLIAGGALAMSVLLSLVMLFWPAAGPPVAAKNRSYAAVNEVDPDKNRLVVQDPDSGTLEEFVLGRKQQIFRLNDQKNILLRDLLPGDRVELVHDEQDHTKVLSLTVDRPVKSTGAIRQIDAGQNVLTVTLADEALKDDLLVRVPPPAKLALNGAPVKLAELQVGDAVELLHVGERSGKKGRVLTTVEARRKVPFVGWVERYDADLKKLAVEATRGAGKGRLVLPIAADCSVMLNGARSISGQPLTVADLQPGDRVALQHDTAILEIIATRSERLSGMAMQLDVEGGRLIVSTAGGQRNALALSPRCEATLGVEKVPLTELRTSDDVEVLYTVRSDGNWEATQIDARRPTRTDRWTWTLAAQNFSDPAIARVPNSQTDARRLQTAFLQRYCVPVDRARLLLDPTVEEWRGKLKEVLQDAVRDTQLVVTIVAPLYRDPQGRAYFAGQNTRLTDLAKTGLPLDEVVAWFNESACADKLLILESPPAGMVTEAANLLTGPAALASLSTKLSSTTVLCSAVDGEPNRLSAETRQSAFLSALARGVSGSADRNRDLKLTGRELFDFTQAELAQPGYINGSQTPLLITP